MNVRVPESGERSASVLPVMADDKGQPVKGLAWKLNRLSRMGPAEIAYRISQQARAVVEDLGIAPAKQPPLPEGPSGRPWLEIPPAAFETSLQEYVSSADAILAGNFRVFALRPAELGFPPEWNRDPRTGTRAPLEFGKRMNYRDPDLVGDIKYLWEPARHLELVRLAQAWHLTGKLKYLSGVQVLLCSWFDQCPYPRGAHWVSSLELAVRLVNWSFAWHLIGGEDSVLFRNATGQAFRRRWLDSIYQHCAFIRGHFSRYSSANNHLLGEYMGLFIASVTWPMWSCSERWLACAKSGLEREVGRQVSGDGVNREQASWYHHEVADMLLLCGLAGRNSGTVFSEAYWQTLERMIDFVASLMDVGGNVPMIGDSDDAVMVDLGLQRNVYHSLLASGAVLFSRPEWYRKAGNLDEKSRWLLGASVADTFLPISESVPPEPRRAFEQAGYFLLGNNFDSAEEIRIVADAGPLGYLSLAAHGHADALSFTLSLGGREFLIDPGTFAYHTQPRWRAYFRGTSAHNTLRIDREDQSVVGGNFMWLHHASAQCEQFSTGSTRDRFSASHGGYRRLQDPVVHRRSLDLEHASAVLTVTDAVICRGKHEVEMFWHLAEDCCAMLNGHLVSIEFADRIIDVHLPENRGFRTELVRGDAQTPLGWVSREFDSKAPITTIRCTGWITGSSQLKTVFTLARKGVKEG